MRISLSITVLCLIITFWAPTSTAQTTLNPDISLIPRFRLESDDGQELPNRRVFSRPEFTLEEFELAIQGYLNPYARADVFLAKRGAGEEPIEIEEAYATFLRGLPLDLNMRIGKYLAEFGKLNTQHPHAWPFVSKPLSVDRFLGEEGVNDLGISASILLPTGDVVYSKITLDVLRGNSIAAIDPASGRNFGGPGLIDSISSETYFANSARLMTFFPIGESSDLEIGFSGLTGIHDPYGKLRFYYGNFDFKYKWKPSAYTSIVLQGEGLLNTRKTEKTIDTKGRIFRNNITTGGYYVYGDVQFSKVFSLGVRYDWSQSPYSANDRAQGGAVFFGFYPVEETAVFRLQYQRTHTTKPGIAAVDINTVTLQFMFSLGPHKAHPF